MKLRNLRRLRIVVTRAAHQASELADPLRALGAEPILLPVIAIAPPDNQEALRSAAARINEYDWLIFTSANAITSLVAELPDTGDWLRPRIATVGSGTREVAEDYGLRVSLTPEKYVAEALAGAFQAIHLEGARILIPSAAVTRDVVPEELRRMGAQVDVVEAYQTVLASDARTRAGQVFRDPLPDWVTFASSSAADHLARIVEQAILDQVRIASIGPVTSATIREHGLTVSAEATVHTVEGLVQAIQSSVPRR